jgi:hypothetical protein
MHNTQAVLRNTTYAIAGASLASALPPLLLNQPWAVLPAAFVFGWSQTGGL